MAITKLNSLAIPPNTIVESDLSYPLTNFSSTGIDDNASSTAVTINSSQNVGIGTASPAGGATRVVDVYGSSSSAINFHNATSGTTATDGGVVGQYGNDLVLFNYEAGIIQLGTSNTERMRLDSSGNLLVGKTSTNVTVVGTELRANGLTWHTTNGIECLGLNRLTSDGKMLEFRKDGTNVGAIGTNGGSLYIETNASERMRIDSSGNVGIGVTPAFTPGGSRKLLQIANGGNGALVAMSNSSNEAENPRIFSDSTNLGFATATTGSGQFQFYTGGSERMRINSSGNVMINTTSSDGVFNVYNTGSWIISSKTNATGTVGHIRFDNGNGFVGSIQTSGSSTAYYTTSDYRLKENVVDLTGAANRLKQIPVYRFNFIADADVTVDGFLAHEVADVVPEAISGAKDEIDDEGNPVYQGIDQSKLVPLLTAALQEALTRIESLETRLSALEAN